MKKKKCINVLRLSLRLAAMLLIAYSLFMLFRVFAQVQQGRSGFTQEVEALRPQRESVALREETPPSAAVESILPEEPPQPAEPEVAAPEDREVTPAGEEQTEEEQPEAEAAPEQAEESGEAENGGFQLAALQAVNPDIVGWLIVDGTEIDFPLMQDRRLREAWLAGEMEAFIHGMPRQEAYYKYLYHDYLGQPSLTGSITLDFRNEASPEDGYLLIYGHNAGQRGVMFSDLKRFLDADFFAESQSAVLFCAEGAVELELMAVSVVDGYSRRIFGLEDRLEGGFDRAAALEEIGAGLLYGSVDGAEGERLVLLNTCYVDQRPEDPQRLLLLYRVAENA